ncbi:MAG: hypothetical protein DCC56_07535 [Anaerolineae bacterium]|nr:MAG: hypothetical protein DCC56_07535 [Anaerolineae bacterium]WKZ45561.1 MAG: hypothetical protein QY302_07195 [Anaerolineales bacterium]
MTKFRILLFSLVLLVTFASGQNALADIGPKPTMDFKFESNLGGGQVAITSGILYECEQADCADASPLEELGPQRLTCEEFHCSAIAYGFAPYHRLEIQFSDGATRQSNIFETINFSSKYLVTVNPSDLSVEKVSGSPAPPELSPNSPSSAIPVWLGLLVLCVILLLLIGLGVALVMFLRRRARQ